MWNEITQIQVSLTTQQVTSFNEQKYVDCLFKQVVSQLGTPGQ